MPRTLWRVEAGDVLLETTTAGLLELGRFEKGAGIRHRERISRRDGIVVDEGGLEGVNMCV